MKTDKLFNIMKNYKNNYTAKPIIAALVLVLLTAAGAMAKSDEVERKMKEKYQVNEDALLVVQNKYGSIHCHNWNENAIEIEVTITVEARNEEKAQKIMNRIGVSISGSADKVKCVTSLDGGSFNNVEFSIDYEIMMPASVRIDLVNKFGDLYVDEVNGEASIDLSYGDLEVAALNNPNNTIEMKFSDGEFGYIANGDVKVSYGEVEIDGADQLDITSNFSELDLGKFAKLDMNSQYDDISIEKTGPVSFTGSFTDMEIEALHGNFKIDSQYGDVQINYVDGDFTKGEVYNSFADVYLTFAEGAAFTIDAEAKFGDLYYPESRASISHKELGYTTNIYKGTYGAKSSNAATLKIRSKNSSVTIK